VTVEARILAELERRIEAVKTYAAYRARLWGAVLRLYNGGRDAAFEASFIRSIDQQLTEAWINGASEVGVERDEMTAEDFARLEQVINNETDFVSGVMDDIQAAREAGVPRDQFDKQFGARVDLWANRYSETTDRARTYFGSKLKFEWQLGATEKHCPFCRALNGIVAFGYEWDEAEVHPQNPPNPALSGERGGEKGCEGWQCDCKRTPTTKRRTGRALDRLTEIATRL
jgi:hypothetical protein